jgi:hypothetical protein
VVGNEWFGKAVLQWPAFLQTGSSATIKRLCYAMIGPTLEAPLGTAHYLGTYLVGILLPRYLGWTALHRTALLAGTYFQD